MWTKITTDGFTNTVFPDIACARRWCIGFFKKNPSSKTSLEITTKGIVRGWVICENGRPIWQKNIGGRYSEFYTLNDKGVVMYLATDVLNGRQLYEECQKYPPMPEIQARQIKRKFNQYGIKNERNVGQLFQVVDTETWNIVRHGWTFVGVNRYTDKSKEVIIYVPSRRLVEWKENRVRAV